MSRLQFTIVAADEGFVLKPEHVDHPLNDPTRRVLYTYCNEHKLVGPHPLADGDEITLSKEVQPGQLRFTIGPSVAPVDPSTAHEAGPGWLSRLFGKG
jgi:hypothetical protein